MAFNHEVPMLPLIETLWAQGKETYLPIMKSGGRLQYEPYTSDTPLEKNQVGILEPITVQAFPLEDFDVVLVPLVGFDEQGHRLGMGAGYYDKTFAFLNTVPRPIKPKLVGIAYECQCLEVIAAEPWDVSLDYVITEKKVRGFSATR
jgi:5-formyltetrahydrofolate cyclo-ligase